MECSAVVCAVMSGIALEQTGGFQLNYMEGTLRTFVIFSWIKLLVYHLRACLPHTLYLLMVIAHWTSVGCQRIESDALTYVHLFQ